MYQQLIIQATNCSSTDATQVEGFMRDKYSTLDGLSRTDFFAEAKAAYKALLWSRTPAGLAYIKELEKEFYA